jgi:polyisoprenoid-binding protein YceI
VSFTGTASDPDIVDTLQLTLFEDSFVCDGRSKALGELTNAAAWEAVTFTAERADDLVDGTADADGRLTLRWQCSTDEAATWQVTARGLQSNRVGEFTIVGVAPPPEVLPTPTVQVDEDPFLCDGGSRVFATLSGFLPGEIVDFVSPQGSGLTEGQADGSGDLPIRWTCGAANAGTVWELTATGARSGRTVTFTVAGAAPPPAPDPTVTITENPFRCDDTTRFLATINGFTPREFVDFTSPQAENLRQGQADETGTLQVRWTCGDSDIDRTWDITATGATSQRSVSFQVTGAAPQQ